MLQLILLAAFSLVGLSEVRAQTLSIINMDSSREAILLEAALKQSLRANGYTVLGTGTEGYVVLLHGMGATTTQGVGVGVVGSATLAKVLRRESAAAFLSEAHPTNQEFIEKFTAVMGSPVIYLAGTTAIGGNAETVAEVLSTYMTTVIRRASAIPQEPLWTLEHGALTHSTLTSIR